jgi:nucleotide-binding universal stress UspA family protein
VGIAARDRRLIAVKVVVWIQEGTWPVCARAARSYPTQGTDLVLLHVTDHDEPGVAHGAYAGLLGRGHPERDPGTRLEQDAARCAAQLLDAAADRLGRPCTRMQRCGRVEREVIAAAEGADLLILARDGDRSRLGPKSLARAGRFVVDHAPCPVLLLWPEPAPALAALPPPHH